MKLVKLGIFGYQSQFVWVKQVQDWDIFILGDIIFKGKLFLQKEQGVSKVKQGKYYKGRMACSLNEQSIIGQKMCQKIKVVVNGTTCEGDFNKNLVLVNGTASKFGQGTLKGYFVQGIFARGTVKDQLNQIYISYFNNKWFNDDTRLWPFNFPIQRLNPKIALYQPQKNLVIKHVPQLFVNSYVKLLLKSRGKMDKLSTIVFALDCFSSYQGRHEKVSMKRNLDHLKETRLLKVIDLLLIPVIIKELKHVILIQLNFKQSQIKIYNFKGSEQWIYQYLVQIVAVLQRELVQKVRTFKKSVSGVLQSNTFIDSAVLVCNRMRFLMLDQKYQPLRLINQKMLLELQSQKKARGIKSELKQR